MASSYATNRFPVPWLLTSPRLGYPALWVLAPRSRSHPSRAGWNQLEWGLIDISLSETVILAVCSHDLTASRCKRHAQSFRACDRNVALSRGYQRDVVVSAQRGSRPPFFEIYRPGSWLIHGCSSPHCIACRSPISAIDHESESQYGCTGPFSQQDGLVGRRCAEDKWCHQSRHLVSESEASQSCMTGEGRVSSMAEIRRGHARLGEGVTRRGIKLSRR
ncbi:hypothetical protein QBC33DRAFT_92071 [Phialemonium atrogriseum]|uniref:Uncharacterized protein n=1 Tax=Phialemonium atrogriseum TaxID=1093897 RepID=A0AAJ0FN81_9PEZI|nr:uncharacterized protein QBC33DRAFT_92071 [Phialemonium atrogriseum]KAK1766875.1 hypothetical protein QBC33DRAFT_92071 [Phialemonium atrogriseum]